MNIIKTATTYASIENATKALRVKLEKAGYEFANVRYLIAVNESGRFAPVLFGEEFIPFAFVGVTVVG